MFSPPGPLNPFPFLDLSVFLIPISGNKLLGTFSAPPESTTVTTFHVHQVPAALRETKFIQSPRHLFVFVCEIVDCRLRVNSSSTSGDSAVLTPAPLSFLVMRFQAREFFSILSFKLTPKMMFDHRPRLPLPLPLSCLFPCSFVLITMPVWLAALGALLASFLAYIISLAARQFISSFPTMLCSWSILWEGCVSPQGKTPHLAGAHWV